jgi:predicted ester cyclase
LAASIENRIGGIEKSIVSSAVDDFTKPMSEFNENTPNKSCTGTAGPVYIAVYEKNKAAARMAFEVWNNGDLERLDRFVSPTVVHHDPYDPHGSEGLVGMKKSITRNRTAYPDLHISIEDQIAEGDKVATRWTSTMTHKGKRVTLKGITIDRFENGMIVEAWRSMDMLGLLQQTGAIEK